MGETGTQQAHREYREKLDAYCVAKEEFERIEAEHRARLLEMRKEMDAAENRYNAAVEEARNERAMATGLFAE